LGLSGQLFFPQNILSLRKISLAADQIAPNPASELGAASPMQPLPNQ
jgi:hypothetical protein